jgi:hypothetical protein
MLCRRVRFVCERRVCSRLVRGRLVRGRLVRGRRPRPAASRRPSRQGGRPTSPPTRLQLACPPPEQRALSLSLFLSLSSLRMRTISALAGPRLLVPLAPYAPPPPPPQQQQQQQQQRRPPLACVPLRRLGEGARQVPTQRGPCRALGRGLSAALAGLLWPPALRARPRRLVGSAPGYCGPRRCALGRAGLSARSRRRAAVASGAARSAARPRRLVGSARRAARAQRRRRPSGAATGSAGETAAG